MKARKARSGERSAMCGGDPEERIVDVADRDRSGADRRGGQRAAGGAVEAERRQHRLDDPRGREHGAERIALQGLHRRRGEERRQQAEPRIDDLLGQQLRHAGLVEHAREAAGRADRQQQGRPARVGQHLRLPAARQQQRERDRQHRQDQRPADAGIELARAALAERLARHLGDRLEDEQRDRDRDRQPRDRQRAAGRVACAHQQPDAARRRWRRRERRRRPSS